MTVNDNMKQEKFHVEHSETRLRRALLPTLYYLLSQAKGLCRSLTTEASIDD